MKKIEKKIGIIGLGNMGGAIAGGLSGSLPPEQIHVYDTDPGKSEKMEGVTVSTFIEELNDTCEVLIIAVKTDKIDEILSKLCKYKGIIVSVAAGITIETLARGAGIDKKIVRAMPNTPALSGCGMTVICAGENVNQDELEDIKTILMYTGKVLILPEKLMDAVTGVSGSGPAYVFTFIQAIADGAVKMGIPRDDALTLAAQTVYGSAKMFLDKKENPIKLRDQVASPGGTTIEAIHVLEKAGFSGIIIDAIEAATLKSKELGKT